MPSAMGLHNKEKHMGNKLVFANTGPQLSHIIKDHPKETMPSEAVRNMIEAATAYKPNQKVKLKIRKLDLNGLIEYEDANGKTINRLKNKLSFFQPGGMTATELTTAFTKIGSSVGKENSLDRNYGQGIRTSVLYWSDLACITYKNGIAHYVHLGKEDLGGNDFEIRIHTNDGTDSVAECTDWVIANAKEREYNLDEDFTEVIILGKNANPTQDTFLYPYGNEKKQSILWLRKAIYTRFWKLPKNVELLFHASVLGDVGAKKNTGYRNFMTFEECLAWDIPKTKQKPKSEIVKLQNGVRIHYVYDSPLGENYKYPNAPYSTLKANDHGWGSGNISGIILKNEMYDVKHDSSAEQSSFIKLGIHQDFRNFKIMYELPQDAGYTYDMYRTTILNGQDPVLFDDDNVLQDIVDNMPEWFETLVDQTKIKPTTNLNEEILKRLAEQKSLSNAFAGMTTSGSGSMRGQRNGNGGTTPKPPFNKNKRNYKNNKGKKLGEPVLPQIISNPSATEPYFAKVEGTSNNPSIFINPEWKQLENLASQLDIEGNKGRWYVKAKEKLQNEFTICSVIWYLNALSENIRGNISSDEYQDTIVPKSINMYLMAIQTSIFNDVRNQLAAEYRVESKEVKKSQDELIDEATAVFGDKYCSPKTNGKFGTAEAI